MKKILGTLFLVTAVYIQSGGYPYLDQPTSATPVFLAKPKPVMAVAATTPSNTMPSSITDRENY